MKKTNAALLQELAILQAAHDKLQKQFVRVNNQLTVANEMNQQRQELIVALEKELTVYA